ncbi:hypothetical protein ACN08Y_10160 [Rothia sp. P5764]|uniref:hypothetical protein n=1 Tax=Rothia sp. P5764 TaxID=3402654 RepID=UPI003AD38810
MSTYTKIHADNAVAYKAITDSPTYMEALAESARHGKDLRRLRKLYAKHILGNRINPSTKADIDSRFCQAWEQARSESGRTPELGNTQGGLTPRHLR